MKVTIGRYPKNNKEPRINVRIDPWDTWNMDVTLAHIVIPMLKQLKETKHGAPCVDDSDVPEHLRKSATPPTENEWETDDNYFKRWDWVIDEMIFAFESKLTDWEEQFWKVKPELDFEVEESITGSEVRPLRWKTEGECDWDARKQYEDRIQRGFVLFGKYYQSLWD